MRAGEQRAIVLAAADPASPYGAAVPWPERPDDAATGHRPGRKAGALVVLVDGHLVLYVERGGRTPPSLPPTQEAGLSREGDPPPTPRGPPPPAGGAGGARE